MSKISLSNLSIFILCLVPAAIQAQESKVYGRLVADSGMVKHPVQVQLLDPADSGILQQAFTENNGLFYFRRVAGTYLLAAQAEGFYAYYSRLQITDSTRFIPNVVMRHLGRNTLGTAVVVGNVPLTRIKGDTTEFNAGSVKTSADATAEDLLGKMPGVTTTNGKLQVQGEEVKKVTVDGRTFFGDDPSAALKNLPAEVIEKVQVFDRKSDQASFSGMDDGNSSKSLNIITKMQYRNGTFGRAFAGYGSDERYKGGFSLNNFKGNRRLTLLGQINNVNDQNFSSEDLLGVMSGGGGMGGMGGGMRGGSGGMRGGSGNYGMGGNNFSVDQKNGISETQAFGLNFQNKWKKLDFSGSYFFNRSSNNTLAETYRTYITTSNSGLRYDEKSESSSTNMNNRLNLRADWKLDSFQSLLISLNGSMQNNKNGNSVSGKNYLPAEVLSTTANGYENQSDGYNLSAPILYRRSFRTAGRTFSLNVTPGMSHSLARTDWTTLTQYGAASDTQLQNAKQPKDGRSLSTNASWTEPLSKTSMLTVQVTTTDTRNQSEKRTYRFDELSGEYSLFDTLLSNSVNSHYSARNAGLGYRYNKDKWNVSFNLAGQLARLTNDQEFPTQYQLNKPFKSVLPSAMIQYKLNENRNIRLFYRTNNNAPGIDQLQNVVNNTNAVQLSTGNLDLKQDYQHSLFARYNAANKQKNTSLFWMVAGTLTQNYIGNSTFIASADTAILPGFVLKKGSQLTRPVNMDGNKSLRTFANYSIPVTRLKVNLNFNAGITWSRTPGMVNNAMNYANNTGMNGGFVVASNISEKIDFTISSNTSWNLIANTLQTQLNSRYINQNTRVKFQINPWKGLVLAADMSHQYYKGLSGSLTQNYMLLNSAVAWKFGTKKLTELRFYAFDLLRQNNSISRNTTETYYEDVQTQVLRRYYMLTLTWNFRAFKSGQSLPSGPAGGNMPPWHRP
ncbi:MAG: outer membrane beta-barrel protein [Bacteroidetes bacterium]|nr:outer membrane beta-barrel protein [Bacteroidota bacterium]